MVFIYGDTCYIANSGDSRAIMSSFAGDRVSELSLDHKPSDEYEQKRILDAGGKIYQYCQYNIERNCRTQTPPSSLSTTDRNSPLLWDPIEFSPAGSP